MVATYNFESNSSIVRSYLYFSFLQDEQEVMRWLVELKLANYFDNFKAHGFDMVSMRAITPEVNISLYEGSWKIHGKRWWISSN